MPFMLSFSLAFLIEASISSSPYVSAVSPVNLPSKPSKLSWVRSTRVPFKSSIITEFFFTTVSVSDDEMIPTSVTTPIMNKTMPDNTMPVTVASVNLKKSFIVHIVFMPALLKLTKINNWVEIHPISRIVFCFVTVATYKMWIFEYNRGVKEKLLYGDKQ